MYYPADLYDTVKWHDGQNLSAADFVVGIIMTFDRSKEASAIYDADTVGNFDAFLATSRVFRLSPPTLVTIATYDDNYVADAELDITTLC